MKSVYDRRITRAEKLAARFPESSDLLVFYIALARFQKPVFENLNSTNLIDLLAYSPALIELVMRAGPDLLRVFAHEHLQAPGSMENLLRRYWEESERDTIIGQEQFFARVLLQPYAEGLMCRGNVESRAINPRCPFCGSKPVAGILRGEGEGAKRSLLCSLCSNEWLFRRVLCPNCGEEHKDNLPVYIASEMSHVRVEACDTCKCYVKSVDLTKDGLAVPVVDEIATIALNIWSEEHGYSKLETNLLGT